MPPSADHSGFAGILEFLGRAERLKSTRRSAWTRSGEAESVASHTWRLCLLAMVVGDRFPEVNLDRVIRMLLVHDLGEAVRGDIPAPRQRKGASKARGERRDLAAIVATLSPARRAEILDLYDEYEACESPEARLAKGLDKLETILQHTEGTNPAGFDYAFNLEYGRQFTGEPRLAPLREVLDRATRERGLAELAAVANLGPVSAGWLWEVGITSLEKLKSVGAVEAFGRVTAREGRRATANLLYALHAAIAGKHWTAVTAREKSTLRKAAGLD